MMKKYDLMHLNCADCAAKIEHRLKQHPAVRNVAVNYAALTLHIDTDDIESVRREIKKIEPEVDIAVRNIDGTSRKTSQASDKVFRPAKEVTLFSVALVLFIVHLLFQKQLAGTPWGLGEYAVAITAYLLVGWNVLAGALRTIRKGQLFDENVLMTIATVGAFAIHANAEAIGVMIFFKVGEFLQNLAVTRSRRSIRALLELRPDYANVKTESGLTRVAPQSLVPGDMIIVKAGEKVPLDGIVKEGTSQVNTAAITGESVPATVRPGDVVLAAEINITALLVVKVTKTYADSSIAKILDLVENATANKAKTEQFITKFARYYTPGIVFLSLLIAILPPLLVAGQTFDTWIYRALVLLVISCPCALVISIPLGYFGGIGGASRRGILVKGSNILDALAAVKTVVFDKTGTLTKGVFKVTETVTRNGFSEQQVLAFAALAETHSNHPIARSLIEAAKKTSNVFHQNVIEHREIAGCGVAVRTNEHVIAVGNKALMYRESIACDSCHVAGTIVHVAVDGMYAGYVTIGDEIKNDASIAVSMLRDEGVRTIAMLTGDNESIAKSVAESLGLDEYHANLLPEDKVRLFEQIIADRKQGGTVAFVGDGINDSPVIARADVGIAMGAMGSDAAIETADVVLMTDHPHKAAEAIRIGKRTRVIVWQNIVMALTIKAVFIGLGAVGLAGMWEAVFADVGTALLAVLNSTRALNVPRST